MNNTIRSIIVALLISNNTDPLHAQWIKANGPTYVWGNSLVVSDTNLYVGTFPGVYVSTDNGKSWSTSSTGFIPNVWSLATSGINLFAGTDGHGVFRSINNGASWDSVNVGMTNTTVFALTVSPQKRGGTYLFAGTFAHGIFLSADSGMSWTTIDSGLTNSSVNCFAVAANEIGDTNIFAGTDAGVFLSDNNGASWTPVNKGITEISVRALAISRTNLFAGTPGVGVFLSTNNGASWRSVGLTNHYVYCFAVSGTNLFAGTDSGVFLSDNNGISWTPVSTGLTNMSVLSLANSGTSLYAGTYGGGICRRPLSEMVTSVERHPNQLTTHFNLEQNYPNPFNPSTTISFSLLSKSFVSLKIFDALGKEVSVLLAEELPAGTYARQWNAPSVPTGMYFYQLQAGALRETKRLILLK